MTTSTTATTSVHAPMSGPAHACVVCGAPIAPVRVAMHARTCGSPACDWKLQTAPKHARCVICDRPLSLSEQVMHVCSSETCRRTHFIAITREAQRERKQMLEALASAQRVEDARAAGVDGEAYAIAVIPASDALESRLPQRRRRAFAEFLRQEIATAFERGPDPSPPEQTDAPLAPPVAAVMGQACALCRGHCCRNGGERAYLSADRLRRHLAEHPEQGPEDVLAAYLAHVGSRTMTDSCVYHGTHGCTLPREMRSDTCNRFYCGPLYDVQHLLSEDGKGVYLAAAIGRTVLRTTFVEPEPQPVAIARRRGGPPASA